MRERYRQQNYACSPRSSAQCLKTVVCPVCVDGMVSYGYLSAVCFYLSLHFDTVIIARQNPLSGPLSCAPPWKCFNEDFASSLPFGPRSRVNPLAGKPPPDSRQLLTSELQGLAVSTSSLERQLMDRESVCDGLRRQLDAGEDSSAREGELARQVGIYLLYESCHCHSGQRVW